MTRQLTEEEIAEYKEAFSLLDKDGDGSIKITLLPLLIRSLYKFPTETELADMINEVDPQRKGKIDFSEFLSLMAKRPTEPDPEEELLEAFQYFDTNKSQLINLIQIRHHLTQQGERLSETELEEFIDFINKSNLKVGNSEFKYKDLTKLLVYGYMN